MSDYSVSQRAQPVRLGSLPSVPLFVPFVFLWLFLSAACQGLEASPARVCFDPLNVMTR
jgi:hypothetical protein